MKITPDRSFGSFSARERMRDSLTRQSHLSIFAWNDDHPRKL